MVTHPLLADERVAGSVACEAGLPGDVFSVDSELGRDVGHGGILQVLGGALAQGVVITPLAKGLYTFHQHRNPPKIPADAPRTSTRRCRSRERSWSPAHACDVSRAWKTLATALPLQKTQK